MTSEQINRINQEIQAAIERIGNPAARLRPPAWSREQLAMIGQDIGTVDQTMKRIQRQLLQQQERFTSGDEARGPANMPAGTAWMRQVGQMQQKALKEAAAREADAKSKQKIFWDKIQVAEKALQAKAAELEQQRKEKEREKETK